MSSRRTMWVGLVKYIATVSWPYLVRISTIHCHYLWCKVSKNCLWLLCRKVVCRPCNFM